MTPLASSPREGRVRGRAPRYADGFTDHRSSMQRVVVLTWPNDVTRVPRTWDHPVYIPRSRPPGLVQEQPSLERGRHRTWRSDQGWTVNGSIMSLSSCSTMWQW